MLLFITDVLAQYSTKPHHQFFYMISNADEILHLVLFPEVEQLYLIGMLLDTDILNELNAPFHPSYTVYLLGQLLKVT